MKRKINLWPLLVVLATLLLVKPFNSLEEQELNRLPLVAFLAGVVLEGIGLVLARRKGPGWRFYALWVLPALMILSIWDYAHYHGWFAELIFVFYALIGFMYVLGWAMVYLIFHRKKPEEEEQ